MFDWANSPVSILIITFVFSVYFSREIVGDPVRGQALWGYAVGVSGLVVAVLSPILGAVADAGGRRKPWILAFTALCVCGATMLWFAKPAPEYVIWALVWAVVVKVSFEFGVVFNNAMLPDLVAPDRLGRWSGWGWGLGYLGALSAMGVALVGFVLPDAPLFGLDKSQSEHVRVVGPLVAAWFIVFAWPLFAFTPDRPAKSGDLRQVVGQGLSALRQTFVDIRVHTNLVRFLLARMIFADGLTTIFAIGVIYGASTFQLDTTSVILFGVLINATAGIGAIGFARVDDWLGSKRTVVIGLTGILTAGLVAVLAQSAIWFWVSGAFLGGFLGPTQAASRSFMARLAPPQMRAQCFGLYAFSGKATAFLGPVLAAFVTDVTGSQRAGLATALIFISVGLVLLLTVREDVPDQRD